MTLDDVREILLKRSKPCPCGQRATELNGHVMLECPKGRDHCDVDQLLKSVGVDPLETGKH